MTEEELLILKQEATGQIDSRFEDFAILLEHYPELCGFRDIRSTTHHEVFFYVLMESLEQLDQALAEGFLKPEYLVRKAISHPRFATNMLNQLPWLGKLIPSFDVTDTQQRYFDRVAELNDFESGYSNKALQVDMHAFLHLLLMIGEGQTDPVLQMYSENIRHLPEVFYDIYLALNPYSTGEIPRFFEQLKQTQVAICYLNHSSVNPAMSIIECRNDSVTILDAVLKTNITASKSDDMLAAYY